MSETFVCQSCDRELSVSRKSTTTTRPGPRCKDCSASAQLKWRRKNPEKHAKVQLRSSALDSARRRVGRNHPQELALYLAEEMSRRLGLDQEELSDSRRHVDVTRWIERIGESGGESRDVYRAGRKEHPDAS